MDSEARRFMKHTVGFQSSSEEFVQISLYHNHIGRIDGAGMYIFTPSDPNAGRRLLPFESLNELAKIVPINRPDMEKILDKLNKLANTPVRNELPPINI